MVLLSGVEEAGRGPVIGPMVMAAVVINAEDEAKLTQMGVKDSKLLTPQQREDLFEKVKNAVKSYKIITLTAQDVDNALNDETINLNWLEAITSAKLINELRPEKVILDCPSNNIAAYRTYVQELLEYDPEVIAEHKADLNHPVVGAASILAKVTRDRLIEEIKEEVGINFGSGYPSDPLTVAFLKEHYRTHAHIFRKTWASYKKLVAGKDQKKLGDW